MTSECHSALLPANVIWRPPLHVNSLNTFDVLLDITNNLMNGPSGNSVLEVILFTSNLNVSQVEPRSQKTKYFFFLRTSHDMFNVSPGG